MRRFPPSQTSSSVGGRAPFARESQPTLWVTSVGGRMVLRAAALRVLHQVCMVPLVLMASLPLTVAFSQAPLACVQFGSKRIP